MSIGVVYAATGAKYLAEAAASARTVREHNPDLPICLITDDDGDPDPIFTDVVRLEKGINVKVFKMHMDRAPYDRAVYLDADTMVCTNFDALFMVLDRFDIAANQVSWGYHYKIPGLPNTFPEFNSGVIAFRNNEKVKALMRRWEQEHYRLNEGDKQRLWDQKAFRYVMWDSDVRIAWLPPEYNFMPYFPNYAGTPMKILHGRPMAVLETLKDEMDQCRGMRAYAPGIHAVPMLKKCSVPHAFRLFFRSGVFLLRVLWSKLRR